MIRLRPEVQVPRPTIETKPLPATTRVPLRAPADEMSSGRTLKLQGFALQGTASAATASGSLFDDTIRRAYGEVLGREPDAGGLEHFRTQANALAARGVSEDGVFKAISKEMLLSDEHVNGLVAGQYQHLLNREPDGAGLQSFGQIAREHLNAGTSAVDTARGIGAMIKQSPEYQGQHPEEAIGGLYRELLGREPDGEGLGHFAGFTRDRVAQGASVAQALDEVRGMIQGSAEYAAKHPAPAPAAPAPAQPVQPVQPGGAVDPSRVPYINQYSPVGAGNGYSNGPSNCGPTSVAMIARAFGYGGSLSDAQLINQLGSIGGTTGDGTGVNGIAAMGQAMGKPVATRGPGPNTDWIKEQLKAGKLVVANGDYYAMPPHQNEGKTSGHYVCVAGVDAAGNFIVRDPADANVRTVTPAQLAYFMRSNPNGGYQTSIG